MAAKEIAKHEISSLEHELQILESELAGANASSAEEMRMHTAAVARCQDLETKMKELDNQASSAITEESAVAEEAIEEVRVLQEKLAQADEVTLYAAEFTEHARSKMDSCQEALKFQEDQLERLSELTDAGVTVADGELLGFFTAMVNYEDLASEALEELSAEKKRVEHAENMHDQVIPTMKLTCDDLEARQQFVESELHLEIACRLEAREKLSVVETEVEEAKRAGEIATHRHEEVSKSLQVAKEESDSYRLRADLADAEKEASDSHRLRADLAEAEREATKQHMQDLRSHVLRVAVDSINKVVSRESLLKHIFCVWDSAKRTTKHEVAERDLAQRFAKQRVELQRRCAERLWQLYSPEAMISPIFLAWGRAREESKAALLSEQLLGASEERHRQAILEFEELLSKSRSKISELEKRLEESEAKNDELKKRLGESEATCKEAEAKARGEAEENLRALREAEHALEEQSTQIAEARGEAEERLRALREAEHALEEQSTQIAEAELARSEHEKSDGEAKLLQVLARNKVTELNQGMALRWFEGEQDGLMHACVLKWHTQARRERFQRSLREVQDDCDEQRERAMEYQVEMMDSTSILLGYKARVVEISEEEASWKKRSGMLQEELVALQNAEEGNSDQEEQLARLRLNETTLLKRVEAFEEETVHAQALQATSARLRQEFQGCKDEHEMQVQQLHLNEAMLSKQVDLFKEEEVSQATSTERLRKELQDKIAAKNASSAELVEQLQLETEAQLQQMSLNEAMLSKRVDFFTEEEVSQATSTERLRREFQEEDAVKAASSAALAQQLQLETQAAQFAREQHQESVKQTMYMAKAALVRSLQAGEDGFVQSCFSSWQSEVKLETRERRALFETSEANARAQVSDSRAMEEALFAQTLVSQISEMQASMATPEQLRDTIDDLTEEIDEFKAQRLRMCLGSEEDRPKDWKTIGTVAEVTAGLDVTKIGLAFRTLPPNPLIVRKVIAGDWAEKAAILPGDAILELNGTLVGSMNPTTFKVAMEERPLTVKIWRLATLASRDGPRSTRRSTFRGSTIRGP
eukprot:TRINITY_DN5747_c0_g1_i1.p1 TRINITY_DN5747_c0_g1~~TRINITY_DN5747_c0_g1_i1.p1  ORF type:complete len:1052 (+),score=316.54 TRINITY_DN5747_c0_g1_i1:113-3268(+)